MEPLVSIVVPIYNGGEKLYPAVRSIISQTYKNIEIILVDDCSTDNSYEICKQLSREDERIHIVRGNHEGSGSARNIGIKKAAGKYIYFSDSDDLLEPELVETAVSRLEENGADLAVFGFRVISWRGKRTDVKKKSGVYTGDEVRREYDKFYGFYDPRGIQGAPWNKMFRTDKVREYNIEYPPMRRHQDEVFIMRFVDVCEKVVFIEDVLYNYFQNDAKGLFEKFPIDYFSYVLELNNYSNEYILSWNKDNKKIVDMVCQSFLNGTCQALIVMFNPKFKRSVLWRYRSIKSISREFIAELPNKEFNSNSDLLKLMRSKNYPMLFIAARMALWKHYHR